MVGILGAEVSSIGGVDSSRWFGGRISDVQVSPSRSGALSIGLKAEAEELTAPSARNAEGLLLPCAALLLLFCFMAFSLLSARDLISAAPREPPPPSPEYPADCPSEFPLTTMALPACLLSSGSCACAGANG
jgi:hypothetical protein